MILGKIQVSWSYNMRNVMRTPINRAVVKSVNAYASPPLLFSSVERRIAMKIIIIVIQENEVKSQSV
jgi:hypothetical protein